MRGVVGCVLVVALAACSAPGDPPGEASDQASSGSSAAYDEAAVRSDLAAFVAGTDRADDRRAGACFADELLGSTTPEQLREGGMVADDGGAVIPVPALDAGLAGLVADAQLACFDLVEVSTRALTSVRKGDLDPGAYAGCLREALPREAQRAALVASVRGHYDDPALDRLARAQVSCADAQD
jgi:hypothetical protein